MENLQAFQAKRKEEEEEGEGKDDERGKMFQQLSLINQKVNFFLYTLDYDFNLATFPLKIRRD